MKKIVLKGRGLVEGKFFGEMIISRKPLSFLGGIDVLSGKILDSNNNLYMEKISGRIFYLPTSVGSTVGAFVIYKLHKDNLGPQAIVCEKADSMLVTGCAISNIPLVDQINVEDLPKTNIIKKCEIDGKKGTLTILED